MTEKKTESQSTTTLHQWEYIAIRVAWPTGQGDVALDTSIVRLDEAGQNGWEAYATVQTQDGIVHFLKRPVGLLREVVGFRRPLGDPPPDHG